jgi:hypothetical protein
MSSVKNMINWSRMSRAVLGIAILVAALGLLGSNPTGWFAGLYGAFAVNFGLCPACAIAGIMGRNPKSQK